MTAEESAQTRQCPNCGRTTTEKRCPDDDAPTVVLSGFARGALSFEPGDLVNDRYRITGALGLGGYGAVYAATQLATGQQMALKLLSVDPGRVDQKIVRRFYREAQITAQLTCPHTVRVFDVGQVEDGPLFIAMEMLHGHSLDRLLLNLMEKQSALSEKESVNIAIPVLRSLAEAHKRELVHRDLKPGNIMIASMGDDETVVKVLDFGIARTHDSSLTGEGRTLGTPAYMSPEQFRGGDIDGRSDLYALGVILFLCVTGRMPYVSEDLFALGHMHIFEPVPDPRDLVARPVSERFCRLVMKAMAKVPDDRFQDAKEMRKALESLQSGVFDSQALTPLRLDSQTLQTIAAMTPPNPGSASMEETPGSEAPTEETPVTPVRRISAAAPAPEPEPEPKPEPEPEPEPTSEGDEISPPSARSAHPEPTSEGDEISPPSARSAHPEPELQPQPAPAPQSSKKVVWIATAALAFAALAAGAALFNLQEESREHEWHERHGDHADHDEHAAPAPRAAAPAAAPPKAGAKEAPRADSETPAPVISAADRHAADKAVAEALREPDVARKVTLLERATKLDPDNPAYATMLQEARRRARPKPPSGRTARKARPARGSEPLVEVKPKTAIAAPPAADAPPAPQAAPPPEDKPVEAPPPPPVAAGDPPDKASDKAIAPKPDKKEAGRVGSDKTILDF